MLYSQSQYAQRNAIADQETSQDYISRNAHQRSMSLIDLDEFKNLHPRMKTIYRQAMVEEILPYAFSEMEKMYGDKLDNMTKKEEQQAIDMIVSFAKMAISNSINSKSLEEIQMPYTIKTPSSFAEEETYQNNLYPNIRNNLYPDMEEDYEEE
jgi:hypothetical protein